MRQTTIILCLLLTIGQAWAQKNNKDLYYQNEGKFRIAQFTDLHYMPEKPEAQVVIDNLNEALDAEKPQLVVFTGDVVTAKDSKDAWDKVLATVVERKIPWAVVFGNHDDEQNWTRQEIMDYIAKKPYCMGQAGPKDVAGCGNYILKVKNPSDKKTKTILYFMDSQSYSKIDSIKGYGWFDFSQIQWYKKTSAKLTKENNKQPLPALAFFHIPLSEYSILASNDSNILGTKKEKECAGTLNSGMFTAMKEAGDVIGTFVGHDHDNDYIGDYYGIKLAYGRFSGSKVTYFNLGLNGCRIIELDVAKPNFETYIRLYGGEKINQYPNH
ncbi:metallophosphatase [Bacteroidales bacterium]|nr:metallophosphatase [Bacteroidales bacterium]